MARIHNFNAGPAVLPLPVIEELREALVEVNGCGQGIMEISHRSKVMDEILASAKARVRRVLALPEDWAVLFLQGGASLQFTMIPANLLQGAHADYVDTGVWSTKAIKEAKRYGTPNVVWTGKAENYRAVPASWAHTPGALYTHTTSNNTIFGTEFLRTPEVEGPHICDMSSDIASRVVDGSRYSLIYAGAQKNLGPSGVTLVCLSPWAQERSANADLPPMLSYKTQVANDSLYNTPNVLGIYVLERVLAWVESVGLEEVAAINERKAGRLYELLDSSDFWRPHAEEGSRSRMNITWRLPTEELENKLVKEATAAGFVGLKGHRDVGGLRASLYNACPEASVVALVDFLKDFEKRNG